MNINWDTKVRVSGTNQYVFTYGNYGGPGFTGGRLLGDGESGDFTVNPKDALDDIFRTHDKAYGAASTDLDRAKADLEALRAISKLPDSVLADSELRGYAGATALGFIGQIENKYHAGYIMSQSEKEGFERQGIDNLRTGLFDLLADHPLASSLLALAFVFNPLAASIIVAARLFSVAYTSPIVLDLNNNGVELVKAENGTYFDIDADGFAERIGWVKPSDGILVRDLNGNGVIDSQKEMFGTDAASTAAAKLKALDTNRDGFVDAKDTSFGTLRLWRDFNQDGVSQSNEFFTLASQGVAKLSTTITDTNTTSAGNILDWKSAWYKADGTTGGNFHDVLFETQNEDSWYVGSDTTKSPTINPDTLLLPLSRGYGVVKSLHLAASENSTVLADLKSIEAMKLSDLSAANLKVSKLLFDWAGVSSVTPESGGKYFNQQLIAFMERVFDYDFKVAANTDGAGLEYPGVPNSTSELSTEWGLVWQEMKVRMLVQGPLQSVFKEAYYSFSEDKMVFGENLTDILTRAQTLKPPTGLDAYWQEIGLGLVINADQFGGDVTAIKTALNTAAGKAVAIYENWLPGQTGDEQFEGSKFSDLIELGAGNDIVTAGNGDDFILGGTGNDTISGEAGNDILKGEAGNDTLSGGSGSDTYLFVKGNGIDTIQDAGNVPREATDRLIITGYTMSEAIFARIENTDSFSISFTGSTTDSILVKGGLGYTFNTLEIVTVGGASKGVDTLRAEVLAKQMTSGNDTIVGWSGLANTINGGAGNDTLIGGALSDKLNGNDGSDTIQGREGADILTGGLGNDTLVGNAGNDLYNYAKGDGIDTIRDSGVTTDADRINVTGYTMSEASFTRAGNTDDMVITFAGSSTDKILVRYGLEVGDDTIETVTIGGTSKYVAALRAEVLAKQTTASNDTITGFYDVANTINGGTGDDTLTGGRLADKLSGDAGADRLVGGAGSDTLTGGAGADTFAFNYYDSGIGAAADIITDFKQSEGDKISLRGMGLDAADFVGTGSLSKIYDSFGYVIGKDASGRTITTVVIDTNHDGIADQSVILSNVQASLRASDFVFV